MQQFLRILAFAALVVPLAVYADRCPKPNESVKTEPYAKTFNCPATSIVVEGEKYPAEYEDCFDITPIKKESVFYEKGSKDRQPLTSVNSLLPNTEKDFKNRTWSVSDVQCKEKNSVTVVYWGGGNCTGCERKVQYRFNANGELEEAKLK